MEIKIQKKLLKKALSSTKKALSKIVIQEERGHLLCEVIGSEIYVTGTNNDLKSRAVLPVENITGKDFSFTLDPKIIEKLLSKMSIDNIRFSFDSEKMVTKVFTTETGKSFTSLQSFRPDRMLNFSKDLVEGVSYSIDREVFLFTLNFAQNYLAPIKEDQKQFDLVVIDRGIVYSANGSNKKGYLVFKNFKDVDNFRIRKTVLPYITSFVKDLETDKIDIYETDRDYGIATPDNKYLFKYLKPNIDSPEIKKESIKSEGPYTVINKNSLIKIMDRLAVTHSSTALATIEISLNGKGDDSYMDISLVSEMENTERIACRRVNDESEDEVKHLIFLKLLKDILTSFETDKEVRFHINDGAKAFKIYNAGEINGSKYILAAMGAYAKVIKE